MRPGPDNPDFRVETVQEFLRERISFGTAVARLFACEDTLPHLSQQTFDVLEKGLRHARIEIDRALLVLEWHRIGVVGSLDTVDAGPEFGGRVGVVMSLFPDEMGPESDAVHRSGPRQEPPDARTPGRRSARVRRPKVSKAN
jgi:hypothetical protein